MYLLEVCSIALKSFAAELSVFLRSPYLRSPQKARSTYEYILDLLDDPDVIEPIKFLRQREVVHFQRFGESLGLVRDYFDSKRQFVMPKSELI